MNTYKQVQDLIASWKAQGLSKSDLIRNTAGACLGWPYVWGAYGQQCTPAHRKAYAQRSACPAAEAEQILKRCPVCSGKSDSCSGCKYYPGGRVLDYDCRGFTRWLLGQAGITLNGAGATSQWNTASNWAEKGKISDLPAGQVCCLFMQSGSTMSHTGMCMGDGTLIHCSGEVKKGEVTDRGWTHYAIPKGIGSSGAYVEDSHRPSPDPGPEPVKKPTVRKGSRGAAVKEMQEILLRKGYDLGKWGADGIFGNKTLAAVKAFQKEAGIQVDGICGPQTWTELLKEG